MSEPLTEAEMSSVLALPGERRYAYTIKRVADWGSIWSLRDRSGWALAADDGGRELVPVWPHPEFAVACTQAMDTHAAESLDLDEWLEDWIPGISRDARGVAVFPTPLRHGVVAEPGLFANDLGAELERFEL